MGAAIGQLVRFWRDERGQSTAEWMMVLVAFGVPMMGLCTLLLATLTEHYRRISFFEILPFP